MMLALMKCMAVVAACFCACSMDKGWACCTPPPSSLQLCCSYVWPVQLPLLLQWAASANESSCQPPCLITDNRRWDVTEPCRVFLPSHRSSEKTTSCNTLQISLSGLPVRGHSCSLFYNVHCCDVVSCLWNREAYAKLWILAFVSFTNPAGFACRRFNISHCC